jgi:hypothetical protein
MEEDNFLRGLSSRSAWNGHQLELFLYKQTNYGNECLSLFWVMPTFDIATPTRRRRKCIVHFLCFLPTTVVFNLLINTHASVLFLCLAPTSINLSVHSCLPPFCHHFPPSSRPINGHVLPSLSVFS